MANRSGAEGGPVGSSVDGMIARIQAYEAMSKDERARFVRKATSGTGKTRLSNDDMTMLMAADGYFQNENGQYD